MVARAITNTATRVLTDIILRVKYISVDVFLKNCETVGVSLDKENVNCYSNKSNLVLQILLFVWLVVKGVFTMYLLAYVLRILVSRNANKCGYSRFVLFFASVLCACFVFTVKQSQTPEAAR